MTQGWLRVPLGEVASPISRPESPRPGVTYRQIGVRWWGKGVYERESVDGAQTQYATFNRIEAGDIIINKIWARHGSVSVVQPELAGCYASTEFPLFRPHPDRLYPQWFYWMTRTEWFWAACAAKSQGTSGKNRIRPDAFLSIDIPLPSLSEQHRITERIECLEARVTLPRQLRAETEVSVDEIVYAVASGVFSRFADYDSSSLKELGSGRTNPIQIGPFGAQLHQSDYIPQGIPVLNVGNVSPDGLRIDQLNYVSEHKAAQLKRYTVEPNDLLFARSGSVGKVCLVPESCRGWLMTAHLFRVRFDPADMPAGLCILCAKWGRYRP